MNPIARWVAYYAPLFGLLAAGVFYRAEWAMNIAVFWVWSTSLIALLGCSIPEVRGRVSADAVEVPKPLRMVSSSTIAAILASGGWFVTAAIWAAAAITVSTLRNSGKGGKATNER